MPVDCTLRIIKEPFVHSYTVIKHSKAKELLSLSVICESDETDDAIELTSDVVKYAAQYADGIRSFSYEIIGYSDTDRADIEQYVRVFETYLLENYSTRASPQVPLVRTSGEIPNFVPARLFSDASIPALSMDSVKCTKRLRNYIDNSRGRKHDPSTIESILNAGMGG